MNRAAERPYSGVRVLDLTRELGSYAARLFADLGADVIRVEPKMASAADNAEAATHATDASSIFLNATKRIATLDFRAEKDREILANLVRGASLVFYEPDEMRDEMLGLLTGVPGPRVITVISYFGLTGPYANYVGSDLVVQALGGIAYLSGQRDRSPLRIGGGQSTIVASIYAAVAAAASRSSAASCSSAASASALRSDSAREARSASSGLIRVARRAGTHVASKATAKITTLVPTRME